MNKRKATVPILLVVLTVLLTDGSVRADADSQQTDRLRIGVALGGGGARGAAHIGVLRELERLRVPIDAIVGTSMGAIVGGLYAAGMTPSDLEALIESLDWDDAFKDTLPRENLRYRRKQDDEDYPIGLELGVRNGELLLPKGVLQGQKLALILRELTLDVAHIEEFDDLPTPFRAVASDIVTGESVVMSSGDLALAMRASMSAPGIFAPVTVGDNTLVDGGLVGNVPVEAIRQMDVDIVIAVDVEFPLYRPEELQSAVSISAQMLTILIRKETQRQLEFLGERDILIRPELGEFGSTNFAEITDAVEPGAVATRRYSASLSALALTDSEFAAHLAGRQQPGLNRELGFVRVRDNGKLSPRVLESRLKTQVGDTLDAGALADDAARLYGLHLYEQVDYKLTRVNGQDGVEFVTREKGWGPDFLQFGLFLQDDLDGNTSFNVAARLTRAGFNSLGAEWRTDVQIGTEPLLTSEFYQPLSFDSRYFVAPRLSVRQSNFNVFQGEENLARYRVTDAELGFDVGRELGLWGELRIGLLRGVGDARPRVGAPEFPNIEFETGGVFASFNIDTLDDAQIPLKGTRARLEWIGSRSGLGADDNFDTLGASFSRVWTKGRHTFNAGLQFSTSEDSDDLVRNFFTLGGFLNLSGLALGEISGPHAGLARLIYYRRSGEIKGSFDIPLYVGASLEAGNVWQSRSEISTGSLLLNGSLFLGADTFLGPVYLAAGFGEGGNKSLYLAFGNTPD